MWLKDNRLVKYFDTFTQQDIYPIELRLNSSSQIGQEVPGLVFVTAFRVRRRISEFKLIFLFAFYNNKGVFAVTSSETTEPTENQIKNLPEKE